MLVFSSLTRISDLSTVPFEIALLPRINWENGDYVVGKVIKPVARGLNVELQDGRLASLLEGDLVVGAFGVRAATLQAVGNWQAIGKDGIMRALTCAGIFGAITSQSPIAGPYAWLRYLGHVTRNGLKVRMKDFVRSVSAHSYLCPTILIIGTSMSAGKTTAARVIIHQLKEKGLKVAGIKLTGAGRYRDILSMSDAGADVIYDFVDAGLPSSICDESEFRHRARNLLALVTAANPDVVVAEAGASPYEPYNGSIAMEELGSQTFYTVLCASDPYAVVGVMKGFNLIPDVVSGITANTSAGIELVQRLTGVNTLRLPGDEEDKVLIEDIMSKLSQLKNKAAMVC